MYRFLVTPRWLGGAALAIAASVVMVLLGNWQLHRYQERSGINHRIDTADSVSAVPLVGLLHVPTRSGAAGSSPGNDLAWTKVSMSGRYDPAHEIQARGRTVNGDVGFEIVTPLILGDGTAVLVDRGFLPAGASATAAPTVPPAPTGQVTVVGQIHLSESRPSAISHRDGRLDTRRISVSKLAEQMPYPVYGAYVLLTSQTPVADPAFAQIPIDKEDSWQNAGYTVQWWLFAAMALFAYGWVARKEALMLSGKLPRSEEVPERELVPPPGDGMRSGDGVGSGDRVADADQRRAGVGAGVEEADRRRDSTDRVDEADRRRAAKEAKRAKSSGDRVEEADRRRAASSGDRVEEADRKRAASGDRPV
ncbi:SURF1 family protein [Actinoplanes sp. TBRC 11911]|uniref:SURF1 family cytochrome oxidase biogenesis protein n=1 Tax=Actinoplanes sp. TBRC 11911 TaxID=2729386 RepID=UPI00145CCFE8|nr:SURF1 family cytochrome oxidase biogenesis protein [Actinoplanes sp. TBRC 11911]NMO55613.1 SURF1 family protein [Actinoplanes sp. TBRC 11911]